MKFSKTYLIILIHIWGQLIQKQIGATSIWPWPRQVTPMRYCRVDPYYCGDSFYSIDPDNFNFIRETNGNCSLLEKTISRYQRLLFVEDCSLVNKNATQPLFDQQIDFKNVKGFMGTLDNITIRVNQLCESIPHPLMNEKYRIEITNKMALISAENIWGVIRAFDTLSQIIQNIGLNQFTVNALTINDYPRFAHRGIMLDTSRHYLPVSKLKENLDAMSYNKMNVFHWHIVDDQSFPYKSQVFPNLSLKGAYNPKTHIYTREDINQVIDYANERGIRVLVEFDTPGHTQSWGRGQPGLLSQCYADGNPNGKYGPIDPTKDSSYEFIKTLFKEVVEVFPEQYLHLGGDEFELGCWKDNPDISQFMSNHKMSGNYEKLETLYFQKVLDIVKSMNRSYIVWQDVFDRGVDLKSDTILHVWRSNWTKKMLEITEKGHPIVFSSCWDLSVTDSSRDWQKFYQCDPQQFGGQRNKLVIGGEACLWGEWIDATNVMSSAWPRALAVAERLWSDEDVTYLAFASRRFNRQYCRMQQRGLGVAPANGPGYCQCDYAF